MNKFFVVKNNVVFVVRTHYINDEDLKKLRELADFIFTEGSQIYFLKNRASTYCYAFTMERALRMIEEFYDNRCNYTMYNVYTLPTIDSEERTQQIKKLEKLLKGAL